MPLLLSLKLWRLRERVVVEEEEAYKIWRKKETVNRKLRLELADSSKRRWKKKKWISKKEKEKKEREKKEEKKKNIKK